jgi:ubiquitin-protein ligase
MEDFVFYELIDVKIEHENKSKVNIDLLLEDISTSNKKDAMLTSIEVGKSIVKELIKIEKKYKDLEILDLYTLDVKNFSKEFPQYTIRLKLDKNYYPMLTPDISLSPLINPITMYEMLIISELDSRNISKIHNIEHCIQTVNNYLINNSDKLECKLNSELTNWIIQLLKNNNFKIKTILATTNNNIQVNKNNGIGYGGMIEKWDVNAYLYNLSRIKETNIEILKNIVIFLESNKENKDIFEIHERFNLNQFWIDLIEKYEIEENKYFNSILDILKIIKHLGLKYKIPFLETFRTTNITQTEIIKYIDDIEIKSYINNEDENEYIDSLKKLQMDNYPYVLKERHYFVKAVKEFTSFAKNNVPRIIMNQLDMIHKSIPITKDNAIFIRRDTDNLSLFKFLVIPNEDTPYKFGCFVFDVFLPTTFPSTCPLVNHTTSRKNNFRFNPNLYSCGKVCLSLLGTWGGQSQSESWIAPNADGTGSTLLQLVLSIYSMIFTENPWYNEPGRENGIKHANTDKNSINYNEEIRHGTIKYAILNQLRYPEDGFEDVIKTYYRLKKDKISKYLSEINSGYETEFNKLIK